MQHRFDPYDCLFYLDMVSAHGVFLFQWNSSSSSFLQFSFVDGFLSSIDFIIAGFPLK